MEEEIKPKKIKDEKFLLLAAINQVENIINLTEENEYKQFIHSRLISIKYELQRQLTNLNDRNKRTETTSE